MKMLPLLHLVELRGMLSISLLRLLWSIQTSTADLWKSSRIFLWRRTVPSAKWIAEKHKKPHPGHLLLWSLCGRVIEEVREVTNR